jgi:hypothetical protein
MEQLEILERKGYEVDYLKEKILTRSGQDKNFGLND